MANTKKRAVGVATIDVELVVVRTKAKMAIPQRLL